MGRAGVPGATVVRWTFHRLAEDWRGDDLRPGGYLSNGRGQNGAQAPTASDVPQVPANPDAAPRVVAEPDADDALSHAQTRALRRCAPLNTTEFKAQRLVVAQQHRFSVQRILRVPRPGTTLPRPTWPRRIA